MVTRVAKQREAALSRDPGARGAQIRDAAALLGAALQCFCVLHGVLACGWRG